MENKKQNIVKRFFSLDSSAVIVAMIVLILLVSILSPVITGGNFLTTDNIMNIFRKQTYIGILACGMTLIMITGNIDLSVGNMMTLLTVICALLSKSVGPLPAILLTLLFGALCGFLNGVLVGPLGLNAFITTLGTTSIFYALTLIISSGYTERAQSPIFDAIGSGSLGFIPVPVIIMAVVVVVFWFLLKRTVFGQQLYAIGANQTAAKFSGIRSRQRVMLTYILTGLCCALAAIVMIARSTSANPQAAGGKEMDVILAVVVGGTSIAGGKGSMFGTVLGFLFIGFMTTGFTFLGMNEYIQSIVTGVILVAALSFDVIKARRSKL
ncbi:MAG: ABC transporter permease [Oscillospiraceae bacterium]|nr:ABC transporter permease [Oscillospiraceae bacterium]